MRQLLPTVLKSSLRRREEILLLYYYYYCTTSDRDSHVDGDDEDLGDGDGDGDREEYCQISTMICILSNNNNKSNRINNKKGRENPPLQTMKIKYKYNR